MSGPCLLVERQDAVALLTLNRPERHNALNPELVCRLDDALSQALADDAVRVIVVTGTGGQTFCSGGDLATMLPLLTGERAPETDWDRRILDDPDTVGRAGLKRLDMDKPVIAAVNGACLAGGFELLLGTDIRIAADHARFGLPEVRHGLIPFAGALPRLVRQIPQAAAMEMMLTGTPIDAAEALRLGLVNRVLPGGQVLDAALALAARIARNGPLAVRELKSAVTRASGRPLDEAFGIEAAAMARVMASQDAREGPRAFVEKREPKFRGI